MKYTEKEIEALRNDPFVKLMSILLGDKDALDKAIKEVENEDSDEEKPTSNPDTHCSFKEDGPTPIISKETYDILIDQVFLYKKNVINLRALGFDFDPSAMQNINHPLLNMLSLLLSSIWNNDFASSFINLVFDNKACREDFVELYKMYCD